MSADAQFLPIHPCPQENALPIVFSTDEHYAKFLSVTMQSLLENKNKDTFYDIVILAMELSERSKQLLLNQVSGHHASLRFYDMSPVVARYDVASWFTRQHLNAICYFRLFLPLVMEEYDKILYLDCDTIILDALDSLYGLDMEGYHIAAARDPSDLWLSSQYMPPPHEDMPIKDFLLNQLSLDTVVDYINSGVMVMNLKALRDHDMVSVFASSPLRHFNLCCDQDFFNKYCKGKTLYIDSIWNALHRLITRNQLSSYSDEQRFRILNKAKIIHFAGGKQCLIESDPLASAWRKIARQTPFRDQIALLLNEYLDRTKRESSGTPNSA